MLTTSAWVVSLFDGVNSDLNVAVETWVPRIWKMSFES